MRYQRVSEPAKLLGPNGETLAVAPDDNWHHRNEPWPAQDEMVDVCWAGRAALGNAGQYGYGRARLMWTDGYMSRWSNERGEVLAFNPDFWRAADRVVASEQNDQ